MNPLDDIIKSVIKKEEERQHKKHPLVVADFGCGDARLARELSNDQRFEVHSFDFVSNGNPFITPANCSNVPLQDQSTHIAIFCLALMGTNIADFIKEAYRVLQQDGILLISEVRSRFESTQKRTVDDTVLKEFYSEK